MNSYLLALTMLLSAGTFTIARSDARLNHDLKEQQPQFFKGLAVVPPSVTAIIRGHLLRIKENGWAEIVPGDLYHGHILLPAESGGQAYFNSMEELFSKRVMLLYHADEQLRRWRLDDGDLPTEKKRPRSIAAYPDGRIVPAASLLTDPINSAKNYEWNGSIYPDDLAREIPAIEELRIREVRIPRGRCLTHLQFDFYTKDISTGDLKVTMDCIDPSARLIK